MSLRHAMSAGALIVLIVPRVAAQPAPSSEVVTELRIHGNYSVPDADVMQMAGIAPGDRIGPETLDAIVARLRATKRFDDVEVRKRYRSLSRSDEVTLILVVRERPAAATGNRVVRALYAASHQTLFMPILDYTEGNGVTYGARFSLVDVLGERGRLTVPLTLGGTRQAALELEKRFDSKVDLYLEPKMPWFVPKERPGAVRPVLFGTDTSFGFKVAWKNPESPVPDYLRLAYQRRELAFAPVTVGLARDKSGALYRDKAGKLTNQLEANVPSLLATVDTTLELREPWKSDFEYLQYFASGRAATALAFRHAVRKAMLTRLDPEQGKLVQQAAYRTETIPAQDRIGGWLNGPDSDERKQLRAWLKDERGFEGSEALWLFSVPQSDLDAAIKHFNIP